MKTFVLIILSAGVLAAQSEMKVGTHAAGLLAAASSQPVLSSAPHEMTLVNTEPSNISVTTNDSLVLQHDLPIRRISIANGDVAEAVAISPTEVLLNGKTPGETSLIFWDSKGARVSYQVHVLANSAKIDAVRDELTKEFGSDVSLTEDEGSVFLRGTVKDVVAADRALSIASTLGKVIDLLRVLVPASQPQILLKVRFADVDRSAATQLGFNIFSMDPSKGIGSSTTGQFGAAPTFALAQNQLNWSISDLLNIFYYRPDLNLGAVLQDLQAKNLLQILAEPNLLTESGKPARFLAGGEFPFPTLQGGAAGVGQITIQFKEFGIKLQFLPTVTPRGTIHLIVTPEVSSLDYANGLTVSGFTIPGLSTRRVQTEVELQDGQSFVIAGLLDNQLTETLNRIPGFANIPLLGKLFQSRSVNKSNTELLVLVTPELVGPIPAGVQPPTVNMPSPFLKGTAPSAPRNPGPAVTGALPPPVKRDSMPVEELKNLTKANSATGGFGSNQGPGSSMGIQPVLSLQPATPANPDNPPNSDGPHN